MAVQQVVTPGNLGNGFVFDNPAQKFHVAAAPTSGDFKHGFQAADHTGWYILDGRATATLSAPAQAAATALGIGASLPDARDVVVKGKTGAEAMASLVGANSQTIAQANLPAVNLTAAAAGSHAHTAASAGAHTHVTDGQGGHTHAEAAAGNHTHIVTTMDNGGGLDGTIAQSNNGVANSNVTTSTAGNHTHAITAVGSHTHTALSAGAHTHLTDSQGVHTHVVPLGGSGTGLDVRQRSMNLNPFIYLGA